MNNINLQVKKNTEISSFSSVTEPSLVFVVTSDLYVRFDDTRSCPPSPIVSLFKHYKPVIKRRLLFMQSDQDPVPQDIASGPDLHNNT